MVDEMISVVVPIYNKEKYLDRCLKTISEQTYRNLEIVLINDGSTDNTEEICKKWLKKDNRILYIAKSNGGVSDARNLGLEKSNGEYITFVDPDDYLKDDCLEVLLDCLERENGDISYCYSWDLNEKSLLKTTVSNETGKKFVHKKDEYYWYGKRTHDVCWGALYRKDILDNVKFSKSFTVGEDTLFFAEAFFKANKVIEIDVAKYCYYVNQESVTKKLKWENAESELNAWLKVCDLYKDFPSAYISAKAAYAARCKKLAVEYYVIKEADIRELKMKYKKNILYLLKMQYKNKEFSLFIKSIFAFVSWNVYLYLKNKGR